MELGISKGYGSPNLSSETEAALERLGEYIRAYRNVNFVFGEGQSPKMRRLRESFDALGLRRAKSGTAPERGLKSLMGPARMTITVLLTSF